MKMINRVKNLLPSSNSTQCLSKKESHKSGEASNLRSTNQMSSRIRIQRYEISLAVNLIQLVAVLKLVFSRI